MVAPVHVPVKLERVLELIGPALERPDPVFVDTTVGLGGHSEAVLRHFPQVRLVGLDRDEQALAHSRDRLNPFAERVVLVHAVYDALPEVLADLDISAVAAILMDLGVSSMQLDERSRGFAYAQDAPLDMRMDASTSLTAAGILNTYSVDALTRVLRDYGEERFARRIATSIVREREIEPFDASARLVEIVRASVPAPARRTGGNPAKRTFQALRIEVNGELAVLERALPAAIDALGVGGRIVVLAYQSLEDRLVKAAFRSAATSDVPVDLPVIPPGHEPVLRQLTRGAETADDGETRANPRAASVRLRAAERLRVAA
jgi:16S rRNA (cytosine1402-N4)-methyltransferase